MTALLSVASDTPIPDKPIVICLRGMDRVTALLAAWNDWRRHGSYDPVMRGAESWLGRMVKVVKRATGEDKLPPQTMPRYDDALMEQVTRIIHQMPGKTRKCMIEHYCYAPWWTAEKKAARCGVSRATYYRRIEEGREFLNWAVDWSQIVVVDPWKSAREQADEDLTS